MITRIYNAIATRLKDPSRSFKERVFIVLTLISDFVAMFALIGDIVFGDNIVEIISLVITIVSTLLITFICVRKNKVIIAIRVVVLGIIFLLLPVLFYFGGGVEGGGVTWIIFAYLYTGLVLSGKWRPVVLSILTIESCGFYLHGYFNPELISQHDRALFYKDSLLSLILVGVVCCMMVWFEEWLFVEENKRAVEGMRKTEELIKAQNHFFSSMSHEIRTPINSILGLNEVILRQEDASDEILRDAANIQGAGRMLLSLINDILDYSKIEAGKMDIVPVNYSVSALVSEIVNMMWMRTEQKGLEFKIEIDPSMPSELYGDEVRIKQILVNLLNNAVKYTKEGSVTLRVESEKMSDDTINLILSVIDTGMGIKQDAIPYLFDAFKRIEEEKTTRIEGTGLGLSIVKQLVELMGGRVTVNSIYTQGSTFVVTLEQKISNKKAVGEVNIRNTKSTRGEAIYESKFTAADARILIVDDNIMNLEVEKKLLAGTGITIDTATSGEKALSLTKDISYDVILMDHLMPEMDGVECMQFIKKQPGGLNNRVPIIVLTANGGSENRELYSRSGFDDYLVKPVSGVQLEEMLLSHLPETKVTLAEGKGSTSLYTNTFENYGKKLPVAITSGSLCDLPKSLLKEYQIDIIPFVVHMDKKQYYDGIEVETDEVVRYMKDGVEFDSAAPSVEEYEEFFGKELMKAHNVIYISVSADVSKDHKRAEAAAQSYGNVSVVDSGLNSSAIGMLVLLAHQMAMRGENPDRIIEEIERVRTRFHCSFVADGSFFIQKTGIFKSSLINIMRTLSIWPYIRFSKGNYSIKRLSVGDAEKRYTKYVDFALPRFEDPDLDVIFVVYSDLTADTLKLIEAQIKKRYAFKNIVFQKASAVLALNCGPGSVGIMYMDKGEYSYNLSSMLIRGEELYEEEIKQELAEQAFFEASEEMRYAFEKTEPDVSKPPKASDNGIIVDKSQGYEELFFPEVSVSEADSKSEGSSSTEDQDGDTSHKGFKGVPELDKEKGIAQCGSEETFMEVLEMYYESLKSETEELDGYFASQDWENYIIKVHSLKSSSRLVGLDELGEKAYSLEKAGTEENFGYIMDYHKKIMADFRSYIKPIGKIFGKED
ncbi:MAG: DegV family EDD domain-containing protein [Lachnospiraceae bacterium]|nr:DegV family EDD domain-containing protein [Lachnospiraceae bacterium]